MTRTTRTRGADAANQGTAPMLRAALKLAGDGWRVIPLVGKKPFLHDWVNLASTDPATIRRWWAKDPSYNIGAVVPDNHVVIDIDPHNGGSLEALEELAGVKMPKTLSILSGRGDGSVHLHYLRPFPRVTKKRMPVGIDVLGAGRQVVMPPSLHPDIKKPSPYRWGDKVPVARLPLEVAALIKPRPYTPGPERQQEQQSFNITTLVAWLRSKPKGHRHDALVDVAVVLREGHAQERHFRKVIEAAVDLGFTEQEARRVIESIRKSNA